MHTEPVASDQSGLVPEAGCPYPHFGLPSKQKPAIRVVSERRVSTGVATRPSAQKPSLLGVDGHKTLAGGIAHNFNNLLMGINGYVELMLLKADPAHHWELLAIKSRIFSGSSRIQAFLQYARGRALAPAEPGADGAGDRCVRSGPGDPSACVRVQAAPMGLDDPESLEEAADAIVVDLNHALEDIRCSVTRIQKRAPDDHPYAEPLAKIDRLLDKGADITLQLLRCSRHAGLNPRPVMLDTLIKEAMDTYGCIRKGVKVHQRFAPGLDVVMADPCQIEQILQNLYLNAADAMPCGGDLFVDVSNAPRASKGADRGAGGFVLIRVRDTGTGMDAATASRIFEPFFSTKGLKGRGLGLSSVHRIVSAHGGKIEVSSNPGHGTTFRIFLPAAERVEAEPRQLNSAAG